MRTRGTISLVFDDGYQSVYDEVVPLLNQLKLPGVFAVSIDDQRLAHTEQQRIAPWREWIKVSPPHEIASHTVTHPDLTTIAPEQLTTELAESAQLLHATSLVYPGGAVSLAIKAAARHYYQAARGLQRGFETVPPQDVYDLRTFNYTRRNFSVARANSRAIWAYLTNSWLIETYHLVSDAPGETVHTVGRADFQRHLQFIAQLPVAVRTIAQVLKPK